MLSMSAVKRGTPINSISKDGAEEFGNNNV